MDRRTDLAESALSDSGQISNWLVKLVVFIGIAGMLIIEGGGVLVAKGSVADTGEGAASEAAFAVRTRGVQGDPESVARSFVESKGCEFVSIKYDEAAKTVSVTVRRVAKTYLIQHIGPLKKYKVSTYTGTRSYAGPG